MDEAIAELDGLLSTLPGFSKLTRSMKERSINGSLVPDSAGVWPGQEGYQATYDVYYAAYGLLGFLRAQPVVRQSSSEGTSVAVDAPNWESLVNYFATNSVIMGAVHNDVLRAITIPQGSHVKRVDMRNYDVD